jgi:hypothetical protein
MSEEQGIVAGRECGSCTLCCRVLGINEIEKPQGDWCPHCDVGKGCQIYDTRPGECRDFFCGYLTLPMVDEKWFPARSKMVVFPAPEGTRLSIHVDPQRPNAWKEEPYHSDMRAWARHVAGTDFQVVVFVKQRAIAILPDRDVDLGTLGQDETIVYERGFENGRLVQVPVKVKKAG